jgi:two-component system chemotaxis response regulator CheY
MHALPQGEDCTVMIVDDSHFMRETLRVMLEASGYRVIAEARDGVEAVQKYSELSPQITIMDVMMPNKGGIDATRDIVALDKNAMILLSSTLGFEDLIKSALEAGAVDVIFKPYKIDEIHAVIDKVMQF